MKYSFFCLFTVLSLAVCSYAQMTSPYWDKEQQSDMPSSDIRVVPEAHANSVRSYWNYQQSLTDLNNSVRTATNQMEKRPEYIKALMEDKAAYLNMDKYRSEVLNKLKENPEYSARDYLYKNVNQQLEEEKFKIKPDPFKLEGMARLKIQLISENRKMEKDVLEKDQNLMNYKQKMLDAARNLEEVRQSQAIELANDPNLLAIRKQVAMARIEKLVNGAYYQSTIDARDIALEYSKFYRKIDINHGYGFGYRPFYYRK